MSNGTHASPAKWRKRRRNANAGKAIEFAVTAMRHTPPVLVGRPWKPRFTDADIDRLLEGK